MFTVKSQKDKLFVKSKSFSVVYDKQNPNYFTVEFQTLKQQFLIPASCDSLDSFDLNSSVNSFNYQDFNTHVKCEFAGQSNLWNKTYFLEIYPEHLEFYYELRGTNSIDTLRFFEGVFENEYSPQFYLTKHFNDHKTTPYRDYSEASNVGFKKIFNPEPNTYNKQIFNYFEYSQISANSDLDYCGGNFIFNPGILCFLITSESEKEWISLGLNVPAGEYYFSEYEYIGGEKFGLNLNYWGAFNVESKFQSPKVIITSGKSKHSVLQRYVEILKNSGNIFFNDKQPVSWWRGPIVCGWGHQCYKADLFRIRSPKDRTKDSAAYFMSTQAHYEEFINALDAHHLDWKILIIDGKWTISAGYKEVDIGRWQNMRDFVEKLHRRGKRVLVWWGLWDTEGLDLEECITYSAELCGSKVNRPGRFAKFGNIPDGAKIAPDATLSSFRNKIAASLKQLLGNGPEDFNLDGIKIDHAAAVPGLYGMKFPPNSQRIYGIELLKNYQKYIYDTAKKIKSDALIIGQSANPYFADCADMLRLGDIYPTNHDVIQQMIFRAEMVEIANPHWLKDMDCWPLPSLKALDEYLSIQPKIGVPSLYYSTHLDTTGEKIPDECFQNLKLLWDKYLKRFDL